MCISNIDSIQIFLFIMSMHWMNARIIRLIIDSEYILTGTVTGKSSDTCLYSGQKNFVRVFKDAMRNEIALNRMKQGEQ